MCRLIAVTFKSAFRSAILDITNFISLPKFQLPRRVSVLLSATKCLKERFLGLIFILLIQLVQ